jgi:phosphatidate cytidylyltransferase
MSVAENVTPRTGRLGDLPGRIGVAVPGAAVVAALLVVGGAAFASLVAVVAAFATFEGVRLLRDARALALLTGALSAGVVAVAAIDGREALAPALMAAFGILALGTFTAIRPGDRTGSVLAGTLCVVWVGVTLAHGVLLRELDHGALLVLVVLLATFLGDTFAHILGSLFGRTPLAPSVSPNKSIEGLVAGIVGGTASVVVLAAIVSEPWLGIGDAAVLGLAVATVAPCGDLFESALKREAGVKDSGTLLGAHGGVLDRVDALLFTVPLGYYLATALV